MFAETRKARLCAGAATVAVTLLLAACGGGGGGGTQAGGGATPVSGPTVQAPTITSQPAAQSVSAGASATFTVAASGTDLAYQWQRDGKDIAAATAATYALANVQPADTGASFTVVVKNAGGSVTSGAAVLTVSPASARGLSLVAGTPGGPGNLDGTDGRLALPVRIALSPTGLLYVADDVNALFSNGDDPLHVTNLRTLNLTTGDVETVGAGPLRTTAMAFDPSGNLYEAASGAVYRTPPGGQRTLFAGSATERNHVDGRGSGARFLGIDALVTDAQGNLYAADVDVVRRIAPDGVVGTVATGFGNISALAIDGGGNIQVVDASGLYIVTPAGAVSPRTLKTGTDAALPRPNIPGIAVDKAGNAYVTDTYHGCRIRMVAPDGTVTDLAGRPNGRGSSDGKGAAAAFCGYVDPALLQYRTAETDLSNIVVDGAGNLIVADVTNGTIRRVTLDGDVSTVAGRAGTVMANVDGPANSARFVLNTLDYRVSTSNWPFPARTNYALAADSAGNVYVGENDRIRKITPDGNAGTLPLQPAGVTNARVYLGGLAFGGSPIVVDGTGVVSRVDADGSLISRPGIDAGPGLHGEESVIVDALGNLYVKYYSGTGVSTPLTVTLRRFGPDGAAATLPDASAVLGYADADGSIWGVKADGTVTRLGQDGLVTAVRTVSASAGAVPLAIARDRAGNLFVAWHETPSWYSVHKITPAGVDSVVAGSPGAPGSLGSFGVRLGAPGSLGPIDALTVGMDGNVYVMSENAVLRIVP